MTHSRSFLNQTRWTQSPRQRFQLDLALLQNPGTFPADPVLLLLFSICSSKPSSAPEPFKCAEGSDEARLHLPLGSEDVSSNKPVQPGAEAAEPLEADPGEGSGKASRLSLVEILPGS